MPDQVIKTQNVSVFGVDYLHVQLACGDELYITRYGIPYVKNLMPDNFWSDREWFKNNSVKLFGHLRKYGGTSAIYRVKTKTVDGRHKDIVLKWNRMGQDVPGDQEESDMHDAEFNSPYEEFGLVMEVRDSRKSLSRKILTHKPMAIYVPSEKVELWQTGRKEHKMKDKIKSHKNINLDMFRSYAVIYEWIKGIDAVEAHEHGLFSEEVMKNLTLRAESELQTKGYTVKDRKPHHVIVRQDKEGQVLKLKDGNIAYALVDFELLDRTPEQEALVRRERRKDYLKRQARRFDASGENSFPANLKHVNIMGVDYVYGRAKSTNGALWIVGRDPKLFDYFLPERWRMCPRTKLSAFNQTYQTVTKDNISLVWKVSRVGERPDADPFKFEEKRILQHGYNSPFEEVALALELKNKDIPTTYPRAIYMTGHETDLGPDLFDESRYESHKEILTPDGMPVLRKERDYIIIWGYWNKPDEMLAEDDTDYYQSIDALRAYRESVIDESVYMQLMFYAKERLVFVGVEDLNLRGDHLLLSLNAAGELIKDSNGMPQMRICSFEMLRRVKTACPV